MIPVVSDEIRTDFEFEELKAEVTAYTEDNYHTESVLAIANYYDLKEFITKFQEIKDYQDSENYTGLSMEQAQERLELTHKMFDKLKTMIGEQKAKELYNCL